MSKAVFKAVNYREFRQFLAHIGGGNVRSNNKSYETAIYGEKGDIQALVHAASIDDRGRCYPAEYFIRSEHSNQPFAIAA